MSKIIDHDIHERFVEVSPPTQSHSFWLANHKTLSGVEIISTVFFKWTIDRAIFIHYNVTTNIESSNSSSSTQPSSSFIYLIVWCHHALSASSSVRLLLLKIQFINSALFFPSTSLLARSPARPLSHSHESNGIYVHTHTHTPKAVVINTSNIASEKKVNQHTLTKTTLVLFFRSSFPMLYVVSSKNNIQCKQNELKY